MLYVSFLEPSAFVRGSMGSAGTRRYAYLQHPSRAVFPDARPVIDLRLAEDLCRCLYHVYILFVLDAHHLAIVLHANQQPPAVGVGESQRVKLANELSRKSTGKTLYLLDEPTTGLHFDDIKRLMEVLQKIVDQGNTVVIIEHNLDVLKSVDYLVDMGPEGGAAGGTIICSGTPEQVAACPESYTGQYLKKVL